MVSLKSAFEVYRSLIRTVTLLQIVNDSFIENVPSYQIEQCSVIYIYWIITGIIHKRKYSQISQVLVYSRTFSCGIY